MTAGCVVVVICRWSLSLLTQIPGVAASVAVVVVQLRSCALPSLTPHTQSLDVCVQLRSFFCSILYNYRTGRGVWW